MTALVLCVYYQRFVTLCVQVPAAHELLVSFADSQAASIFIRASIPARNNARGLYLRDPAHTEGVTTVNVMVAPQFHVDCNNEDKVNFEVQVALKSTAAWCCRGSGL